jgi:hypothetical protein
MDIFISRQPQERLYLIQYDPKTDTSNYREVAFLGWSIFGILATPVGLSGQIHINARTNAWVVEFAGARFTSPNLGIGLFNDFEDVLQRLQSGFHRVAEDPE